MADAFSSHPTAHRRRRQKGPPTSQEAQLPRLELAASDTENGHSDDSAGEKEAKRQRSEPTTPVSTSSRQPWEYDAIMGITRVGTKEAERFEEDLDSVEHYATEELTRKEQPNELLRPVGISGGIGSSSLKECIELLNATERNSPAPLDSGISHETTDPPQVMSPNREGSLAEAENQPSSGSISQATSRVKEEPQSQTERDSVEETKPDGHAPTPDAKPEPKESEGKDEATTSVKQDQGKSKRCGVSKRCCPGIPPWMHHRAPRDEGRSCCCRFRVLSLPRARSFSLLFFSSPPPLHLRTAHFLPVGLVPTNGGLYPKILRDQQPRAAEACTRTSHMRARTFARPPCGFFFPLSHEPILEV